MSDLTVVIATRNRAQQLSRTLARLRTLPERPPVIVVDNASTDLTVDTAKELGARVIRLDSNLGAEARNIGVEATDTEVVAFADDDSWWAAGALPLAEAYFPAYARMGLLAARVLVGPEERLDPVSRFMATGPVGAELDLPGPSVLGFLACGAVVRRSAFLETGGFDPVVHFFGEESRVAYDMAARGWGLAYVEGVVAHHHPSSNGVQPEGRRALARRNAVLTEWMCRPLRQAVAATAQLARTDPDVLREVLRRLPRALARRRRPSVSVEAALARLAAAEAAFFTPSAQVHPATR